MTYSGFYSVAQYSPDPSRLEAANIGVLLMCPALGFVSARTSTNNARPRRFFGRNAFDNARLNAAKRALERRVSIAQAQLQSEQDLIRFVQTRGNDIILTLPRSISVQDPQRDMDALFEDIVGCETAAIVRADIEIPELDKIFHRPFISARVTFDRNVEIPILGSNLHVPYAFRNGCLNLIKPQGFGPNPSNAERVALRLAVEGDLLAKYPDADGHRKLIVIPVPTDGGEVRSQIERLFKEYHVRLVRPSQLDDFAEELERSARD